MSHISRHQKEVELLLFYGYIMGLLYRSGSFEEEMWNRRGFVKKDLWDQVSKFNCLLNKILYFSRMDLWGLSRHQENLPDRSSRVSICWIGDCCYKSFIDISITWEHIVPIKGCLRRYWRREGYSKRRRLVKHSKSG